MLDKVIENNRVSIIGEVVSEFQFSHEVFGEGFYLVNVSVDRLSDMVDIIPLMISERLIDVTKDYRGMKIEVSGQFRSYNRHEGLKNKLILSIFVRELQFVEDDDMPQEQSKSNQIYLDGYVCDLQENSARKRNSRYINRSQSSVWQIRLHTMYRMGTKCEIRINNRSWRPSSGSGKSPEP